MMRHQDTAEPSATRTDQIDLARRIEAHVARRAGGRIADLAVTGDDGRVILCGRSPTHYAKQLAQEAALEVATPPPSLANQIEVSRPTA